MEELLKVQDLRVEYSAGFSTAHALNGVSFSLGRGETLGLVGETGAGKTTTALSIMGLLPQRTAKLRSGSIMFDGMELTTMKEHAMQAVRGARISMIFQDPMTSLNPVIRIGDQIKEALILHNTENKSSEQLDERVDEIIRLVGISPDRKRDYPQQFSGGMKQRVVIAIALACSPELLIADEPTTALDVTIQAQVLEMMRELKQRLNMSMIMIRQINYSRLFLPSKVRLGFSDSGKPAFSNSGSHFEMKRSHRLPAWKEARPLSVMCFSSPASVRKAILCRRLAGTFASDITVPASSSNSLWHTRSVDVENSECTCDGQTYAEQKNDSVFCGDSPDRPQGDD
jgi:ABC-type dipeptide/oligopeptide/nickel transport system ATPase subunit